MKFFVRALSYRSLSLQKCSSFSSSTVSTQLHTQPRSLLTATTKFSTTSTHSHTTYSYSIMGPKRRQQYHPRRPKANAAANATSPVQQPNRPTVDNEDVPHQPQLIDPKRLYSTATGEQAKPFSSLGNTLDSSLLQGLDKMGFE